MNRIFSLFVKTALFFTMIAGILNPALFAQSWTRIDGGGTYGLSATTAGYTDGQTFTNTNMATLTTNHVTTIGSTNALGNLNISNLGYPNPTYGVYPTISGNKVTTGTSSATNNAGTNYATFTTTLTMTEPGNALNFDGADDYVVTPDNDDGLTAFTIEAWVRWTPSATTDVQFICGKGYEQMEIHTGGGAGANGIRFIPTSHVLLDAANVLPTGVWTHVAVVYQPSTTIAKMYINGSEVTLVNNGANPTSTAIDNTATSFYIGSRSDDTFRFNGSMDEVRVWNLVRSQAEIQADRDNSISASSSGLINYYNFNEGTAGGSNTGGSAILPNLTSNSYNGTLTNFALTGSTSNWVESYALVVPAASTGSNVTAESFTANWTAPSTGTVNNYLLEVASDVGFSSLLSGYNPKTIASSSTSSSVIGLSPNTTYYYRVRADKTTVTGTGAYSGSITVTTSTSTITFTNGSEFIQSITPNSADQVLGRFQLSADASVAALTAVSIQLNNTRTGLSNLKLWSSADAVFSSSSDIQLGVTIVDDPLDGNSVSFSDFSNSISTSGTYYFLTADVTADATGSVQGVIVANSSLTISNGSLSGTITNAVLSNNTAPLPVELTSFTASVVNNKVTLDWQTATEINNYGFEILRFAQNEKWETVGFVKGSGNSNSPKDYTYTDSPMGGTEFGYRLKQIDIDGAYEYSDVVEVTLAAPTSFAVEQNFPNPFNPTTNIQYQVSSISNVTLKVYDALGREVVTLINEQKAPGKYEVKFDGSKLSSGIYFYKLTAGDFVQTKKLILMK